MRLISCRPKGVASPPPRGACSQRRRTGKTTRMRQAPVSLASALSSLSSTISWSELNAWLISLASNKIGTRSVRCTQRKTSEGSGIKMIYSNMFWLLSSCCTLRYPSSVYTWGYVLLSLCACVCVCSFVCLLKFCYVPCLILLLTRWRRQLAGSTHRVPITRRIRNVAKVFSCTSSLVRFANSSPASLLALVSCQLQQVASQGQIQYTHTHAHMSIHSYTFIK